MHVEVRRACDVREELAAGLRAAQGYGAPSVWRASEWRNFASFSKHRVRGSTGIRNIQPTGLDSSWNKWYLSHSGCGIKSGIHTTFLARNCGFVSLRACTLRPSAGARRGLDAGSALLRNEAVHTVISGPRAVSWLGLLRAKRTILSRDLDLKSPTYKVSRWSREPPVHSQTVPDSSPER